MNARRGWPWVKRSSRLILLWVVHNWKFWRKRLTRVGSNSSLAEQSFWPRPPSLRHDHWDAAPGSGRKCRNALDGEIGKSGKDRRKIVAHWEFQPSAAFHDRKDRRDLRSGLGGADEDPVPATKSHETH